MSQKVGRGGLRARSEEIPKEALQGLAQVAKNKTPSKINQTTPR